MLDPNNLTYRLRQLGIPVAFVRESEKVHDVEVGIVIKLPRQELLREHLMDIVDKYFKQFIEQNDEKVGPRLKAARLQRLKNLRKRYGPQTILKDIKQQ